MITSINIFKKHWWDLFISTFSITCNSKIILIFNYINKSQLNLINWIYFAWEIYRSSAYGNSNPPECCAVEPAAVRSINISHLQCEGYSSAYNVAPLHPPGPGAWTYGLRLSFSLPENNEGFCGSCRSTGGVCGYDQVTHDDVCICGDYNSTSNCDSLGKY